MTAPTRKPLWHLGWVGWSGVIVGIFIFIALFLSVDLQYSLLKVIYFLGDWTLVYWFVMHPFAYMSITLFDPQFGPIPLIGLLIACRVCSRPVPAWQQWLATGVAVWGSTAAFFMYDSIGPIWGMGSQAFFILYPIATLGLACLFSWIMFRSWRVTLAFALAIPLPLLRHYAMSHGWAVFTLPVPQARNWSFWVDLPVFILLTVAAPIWWAVIDRGKYSSPDLACTFCGYSREGLKASARCPECGSEPENAV